MSFPWGFYKKSSSYVNQELQIASSNDIMQILGFHEIQFFGKTILLDTGFCDFSLLPLTVSWYCGLIFVRQRYKNLRFDTFLHFRW